MVTERLSPASPSQHPGSGGVTQPGRPLLHGRRETSRSQRGDGLGGDTATQGQAEIRDGQDDSRTGHGGDFHQL